MSTKVADAPIVNEPMEAGYQISSVRCLNGCHLVQAPANIIIEERGVQVEERDTFSGMKRLHELRPVRHQGKDGG